MILIAHRIRCDLSIPWHELKTDTICVRCQLKNYRLASTSRKIAMNFLKEIKVIFFVESSKKGCGTKIGHLSGLKSRATLDWWLKMHLDRLHAKVGWYSATRYTQIPIFRMLPFKQAEHRLSTVVYSCTLVKAKKKYPCFWLFSWRKVSPRSSGLQAHVVI